MNKPQMIILHHVGGTDAQPLADTSHHTFATIERGHKLRGFTEIGYNWVIEKSGKTVKGRDEKKDGAHTIGYNSKSIGICLSGNFDATYPTREQEMSLVKLIREIFLRYPNIPSDAIYPHRKFASKTCYGKLLKDDWVLNLLKPKTPEIKDGSQACKDYLAKQDKGILVKMLEYILALVSSK